MNLFKALTAGYCQGGCLLDTVSIYSYTLSFFYRNKVVHSVQMKDCAHMEWMENVAIYDVIIMQCISRTIWHQRGIVSTDKGVGLELVADTPNRN